MANIDKDIILKKRVSKNFNHTTNPKELKEILLAIDEYFGDISVKRALQILPYVFIRPSNLRLMEWSEVDLDNRI